MDTKKINQMVAIAYDALDEKLGVDTQIIDIRKLTTISDYLIITSANNLPHLNSLIDYVDEKLGQAGFKNRRLEGNKNSTWVLLDYEDIIVHVFLKDERLYYDIERLWKDGKKAEREKFN